MRRSHAYERGARLTTTPAEEENSLQIYEATSPLLVVDSPAVSRRGSFAGDWSTAKGAVESIDLADLAVEGSGSAPDPQLSHLRVVYSPAVARNPGDREQILAPRDFSSSSPSAEAPSLSENQAYRRRGSAVSNNEARLPTVKVTSPSLRQSSNSSSPAERNFREEIDVVDLSTPGFTAFPERKGLRKIVVARIALGIVTCCVLGNLIYT